MGVDIAATIAHQQGIGGKLYLDNFSDIYLSTNPQDYKPTWGSYNVAVMKQHLQILSQIAPWMPVCRNPRA